MTGTEPMAPGADHLMPTYARYPVRFVRGEGARLWDDEGSEYLDFLAGISVSSVGHCHPKVVAAIRAQAGALLHVGNLFYTEPMSRLAQRLAESSLGGSVFFTNSGAEAVEAALKLARRAKSGGEFVVLHRGFHGRTYGALSATPQESKQAPFAPLVPGFVAVEPTAEAVAGAVSERTAAVLLEPVQGESGVWPLPDELLRAAREACDAHGAALLYDEIQCGLGRCGTLWAFQQSGVVPDAMTTAKALGGGLPIGALVTGERLREVLQPGDHGSTFAGGAVVAARLEDTPGVRAVRQRGLMVGFDVAGDAPGIVRRALLERRLVCNATGPETIRFLPPLVIGEDEADEAVARIAPLLREAAAA
jgi:acetylornithine/N-succinyldiaminopimelate aminotransferase